MRLSNQQKWDNAKLQLDQLKKDALDKHFNGKQKPNIVYKATPIDIQEIEISSIYLYCRNEPSVYGKVTKKDVENLLDWINNFDKCKYSIHFGYSSNHTYGVSSGAYSYETIEKDKNLSLNRDELIEIQKELNILYAPKDGYQPCSYCRKQTPIESMVKYKIIFQSSRPCMSSKTGYKKIIDEKINLYCSKECGVHDQMAHEG